ncbi:hypothetical protein PR048_014886 [Dryococelus australis]|uniref:Uncharacterized protein n=1 Tax=Dryococelus australis TaxID=614101 RepID=A0ABQ9HFG0_9NEOP|nr:hypothetical protein PR048_014886 [Dryococelus australis]
MTCKPKYPNKMIGMFTFTQLRPKFCVLAGSAGIHSIYQNVKLLLSAIKTCFMSEFLNLQECLKGGELIVLGDFIKLFLCCARQGPIIPLVRSTIDTASICGLLITLTYPEYYTSLMAHLLDTKTERTYHESRMARRGQVIRKEVL